MSAETGRNPLSLLVFGDNHLLVRGPRPSPQEALWLVRQWMVVSLRPAVDRSGVAGPWRISTQEFREEISWVVLVEGGGKVQPAVQQLVDECAARGVPVVRAPWGPDRQD